MRNKSIIYETEKLEEWETNRKKQEKGGGNRVKGIVQRRDEKKKNAEQRELKWRKFTLKENKESSFMIWKEETERWKKTRRLVKWEWEPCGRIGKAYILWAVALWKQPDYTCSRRLARPGAALEMDRLFLPAVPRPITTEQCVLLAFITVRRATFAAIIKASSVSPDDVPNTRSNPKNYEHVELTLIISS